MAEEVLRIAIPNKGALYKPVIELLEKIGLRVVDGSKRKLFGNTNQREVQIIFARAQDIPRYVELGAADAGITGMDLVEEAGADVDILCDLKLGACAIMLAVPFDSRISAPSDLTDGVRVATKVPNIAAKYLAGKGIHANIIELTGAVELAPYLGIADVIIDHVSTGTTLAVNRLRPIDTVRTSAARLIANKHLSGKKKEKLAETSLSFEGIITAEAKRYVMANVTSEEALRKVVAVMPSMESPTVLRLAKEGEFAVHSVVDEAELMKTVRRLKEAGAKDILVFGMGRMIP